MNQTRSWKWAAGLVMLTATGPAWGQELFPEARDMFDRETFALHAGAAFTNFTAGGTKTLTEPGGNWTVRGTWGLDKALGAEVAYLGAAFPVEAANMSEGAILQTGLEALVRVGYPLKPRDGYGLTPYVAAGMGWSAFNLVGAADINPAQIANDDGIFYLPMGLGVSGTYGRLSADLRFIWRPAYGDEMFQAANQTDEESGQNTVSLGASVGMSF